MIDRRGKRGAIQPIYRPHGESSRFLLYDGELVLDGDADGGKRAPGQVELRLFPRSGLYAHVFGPTVNRLFPERTVDVSVPEDASLAAPAESAANKQTQASHATYSLDPILVGDISKATQLLIHVSGALDPAAPPVQLSDGKSQHQLDFSPP